MSLTTAGDKTALIEQLGRESLTYDELKKSYAIARLLVMIGLEDDPNQLARWKHTECYKNIGEVRQALSGKLKTVTAKTKRIIEDRVTNEIDPQSLIELYNASNDPSIRRAVVEKLWNEEFLFSAAMGDDSAMIRIQAVRKIYDQKRLLKVVLENGELSVSIAAFERLRDEFCISEVCLGDIHPQITEKANEKLIKMLVADEDREETLELLAALHSVESVRRAAVKKLPEGHPVFFNIVMDDNSPRLRELAFDKITDMQDITAVIYEAGDGNIAEKAVSKISSSDELGRIALCHKHKAVRLAALSRLSCSRVLAMVAGGADDLNIAEKAVAKITDQALLKIIADTHPAAGVRDSAKNRIEELDFWQQCGFLSSP
jgi:hypothetical protein